MRSVRVLQLFYGCGYGLSEKTIQVKKRVRGVDGAPTTVMLAAVPVMFHKDVLRVDFRQFGRTTMLIASRRGTGVKLSVWELLGELSWMCCLRTTCCGPSLVMWNAS